MIETIIKIELPLKRYPMKPEHRRFMPFRERWFGWLFSSGGGSVQEFGGSRINRKRHYQLFRWHILTISRNEYHDRSDAERANEYLSKWSACEKELQMFRIASLGPDTADDVKRVIKESLGVDLDEGTIR